MRGRRWRWPRRASLSEQPASATIVAVTGTSGKTSVTAFVRQIWSQLGLEAAFARDDMVSRPLEVSRSLLTTPGPDHATPDARSVGRGRRRTHLALEASSHGLDQKRLDGAAVRPPPPSPTRQRDRHGLTARRRKAYLAAKLRLFRDPVAGGRAAACIDADQRDSAAHRGGGARERAATAHGRDSGATRSASSAPAVRDLRRGSSSSTAVAPLPYRLASAGRLSGLERACRRRALRSPAARRPSEVFSALTSAGGSTGAAGARLRTTRGY